MSWSTGQIVDIVHQDMPEVSRDRVLEYVSRSYLNLVNQDCSQMVYFVDNPEEPIPVLQVVEGQSRYLLNNTTLATTLLVDGEPVTIRKARRLFTDKYYPGYQPYSPMDYPSYMQNWLNERVFYEIPAQIVSQRGNNPGQVSVFGEFNSDIFVECYWTPQNPMDNESASLLIDTDKWLDAIIDGAVGLYEQSAYGKSERQMKFEQVHMKKFKAYGNLDQGSLMSNQFPTRLV